MKRQNNLSLTRRQVLSGELAWVEGLTNAQIARRHGVTERTIEMRLYRARRRMREAGLEPPPRRKATVRPKPMPLAMIENF